MAQGAVQQKRKRLNVEDSLSSLWIAAHAGSGKTHALISRIVRLLLLGVPPERITAITYTRAAAAEMRTRLIRSLRQLMVVTEEECRAQCNALLERAPTAEELARARGLLMAVLDSPSGGVELTTIHGFCQRLLRAFPLEAGVPPYFTVLEEEEAERCMELARQRLMAESEDGDVIHALALLAERLAEESFYQRTRHIVTNREKWGVLSTYPLREELKQALYAVHGLTTEVTEESLLADFLAFVSAADWTIVQSFCESLIRHKNKREQRLGDILQRWHGAEVTSRKRMIADLLNLFLTTKGTLRASWLGEKEYPAEHPLRRTLQPLADASIAYMEAQRSLACAEESYACALIGETLLSHYTQIKAARAQLDYQDLITYTIRLLTQRDMTAWVMMKLDHRIDHLLIDEAQDTSAGQWQIVTTLLEELMGSDIKTHAPVPRSLFVVGDEKQSIFSFQGANPALFSAHRARYQDLLLHHQASLQTQHLTLSRRSAPAVIMLVNALSASPAIATALTQETKIMAHQVHRREAAGLVKVYPLIPRVEKETAEPFTIPRQYFITRSAEQQLAETISATIARMLDTSRTPGDILILVRRRGRLVPCLIRSLQRKGIPVQGIDRLVLSEHRVVRDMLALIRWVEFPEDDLALAEVLRSPLIGVSEEILLSLSLNRGESRLWSRVANTEHASLLIRWRKAKECSPYEFCTEVLEASGGRVRFSARFGDEIHEVLDELKAQAAAYSGAPSLYQFAESLRKDSHEIKREQEEGNVVRIMTVHGAKGLEAPVVILADTTVTPDTSREKLFSVMHADGIELPLMPCSSRARESAAIRTAKAAMLEELMGEYQRLLYVAVTRAADELHVFGAGAAEENSWYDSITRALQSLAAVTDEEGHLVLRDANDAMPRARQTHSAEPISIPCWATTRAQPVSNIVARSASQLVESQNSLFRFAPDRSREQGVQIHRILQSLEKGLTEEDILLLSRLHAPEWNDTERTEICRRITTLYRTEPWLWEQNVLREVSISGMVDMGHGNIPMNGQIDALAIAEHQVTIVDYKTGSHVPQNEAEIPLSYLLQLKAYAALLAPHYPEVVIRSVLIYTHISRVFDVTQRVAAIAWQEMECFPPTA